MSVGGAQNVDFINTRNMNHTKSSRGSLEWMTRVRRKERFMLLQCISTNTILSGTVQVMLAWPSGKASHSYDMGRPAVQFRS
jgi:hypothetical protein